MERSSNATITNNNNTDTEINNTVPTIDNNSYNAPVTDVNNVTAVATVALMNENTTTQDTTVLATIAPISVNNDFTLHNTVSIDVIKAMDPGYETTIL